MTPYHWSLAIWVGVWLGLFTILEGLALFNFVPWNTFSWTFWQTAGRSRILALILLAITADLLIHLNFGWPTRGRPPVEEDEN